MRFDVKSFLIPGGNGNYLNDSTAVLKLNSIWRNFEKFSFREIWFINYFHLQEKDLIEINKEEVEKDAENDVKEVAEELTREERYEKLCELLKTSKFYSDFLVKKLTEQDEASKNVKSEKLKDRRSVEENSNKGKRKGLARNAKPQKKAKIEGRYFDGEPIPVEQPLLLSGGIMRDYQIEGKGKTFQVSKKSNTHYLLW